MYVAKKDIRVTPKGSEKVIHYKAGEEIPDFAEWPEVPRRAHLNLNYVERVEDEDRPRARKKAAPKAAPVLEAPKKLTPADVVQSVELKCVQCDTDKTFKTEKALKTHVTVAHSKK